uniref:Methylosome protein 50-like n=1 Tax=Hirondellea gigas TaxID=1518452 RepID=A0A6A7FRM5_9CRUS
MYAMEDRNEFCPSVESNLQISEDPEELVEVLCDEDKQPTEMEDRLEFLAPRPGGGCALGCSGMTGRCWSGSVWLYDDALKAPDIAASQASYQLQAGVPCATFVSRDVLAVAEDGGYVEWLSCSAEPSRLVSIAASCSHSDTVTSMALTCDGQKLCTAGADYSICLTDCSTQQHDTLYSPAHAQECLSVSTHPTEKAIFVSCSLDGNVLLWDTRKKEPASCVYRNVQCPVTSVSWLADKSSTGAALEQLLLGTIDGQLMVHSTRHYSHEPTPNRILNTRINKFVASPNNPNVVAVCADDETIRVVKISNDFVITPWYSSDAKHSDFVRDVMWLDSSSFLSCAWDKQVAKHTLPS